MKWVLLALAVTFNSLANLSIKYAAMGSVSRGEASPLHQFFSIPFVLGGILFAGSLICFSIAVRSLPLSIAYPILVGMSTLTLAVCAVPIFGEHLSPMNYAGIVLSIAAVGLMVMES